MFIPKEDSKEYSRLLRKVKHFKIMVFDEKSDAQYRKFEKFVKRHNYTSIFRINDDGEKVEFYFLKRKDIIKEIVLKVKDEDNFVLISLKSNISEQDFNNFIGSSEIEVSNSN